jgi:hypothetical protein
LAQLNSLRYLYLNSNQLTGTIPPELGQLTNLTDISLNSNQLTGTIPPELAQLTNLKILSLNSNQLIGSIPTELAQLTNLSHLYLWGNQLTGTIPPELAQMSNLTNLSLLRNQLCGKIPSELMNLTNLSTLNLQNNNLINTDTDYDADFITWLDQNNSSWRTQNSPAYCSSQLQLSATNYNVNEGDGGTTITVTRTNSSDGTVSVEYATSDDTATAPDDYTQTTGTLNWSDGDDADKTFTIDINNDSEVESDETLIVSLGNPTGGAELGEPDTATVTITDNEGAGALIKGSVELQGREPKPHPSWETEVRVSFTEPSETQPRYSFTTTTDQNGEFQIGPIDPSNYDMRIKGTHTLQNLVPVSLVPGDNPVNVGVLLEGDVNDDNCVNILDFSILASTFGKCEGDSEFYAIPDLNQDGCVTILDFSLIMSNFGQCGPIIIQPMMVSSLMATPNGTVEMSAVPSTSQVKVGETFEIVIEVQAGEQQVDSASAYLDFNPTLLEVVNMTSGDHLNLTLDNSFDNAAGSINFAAGKLTAPFPSGDFELVTITLRAKAAMARIPLGFVFNPSRRTDATFNGASVFDYAEDGSIDKAE